MEIKVEGGGLTCPPKTSPGKMLDLGFFCTCPHLYTNYSESFAGFQLIASRAPRYSSGARLSRDPWGRSLL